MEIYKNMCNLTNFFGLAEYNRYVSVIKDLENMDNLSHNNLVNDLFMNIFFYFNNYCLIISTLGLTIIIGIGLIILYSKPFQEGLKAALTLGATIVAGAQLGAVSRGRDDKFIQNNHKSSYILG